jgi:hypothetical protein
MLGGRSGGILGMPANKEPEGLEALAPGLDGDCTAPPGVGIGLRHSGSIPPGVGLGLAEFDREGSAGCKPAADRLLLVAFGS